MSRVAGEMDALRISLRMFQRNRQVLGRTDDDVIAAMVPFALVHEGAFSGGLVEIHFAAGS